jgi:hypothetical protein
VRHQTVTTRRTEEPERDALSLIGRSAAEIIAQDDLARALSRGDVEAVREARRTAKVARLEAQLAGAVEALREIKARADRIVAGEFGGLDAAGDISDMARRGLRAAGER